MLKKFIRNENGNFAMMLALASLPLMFAAGAAVDYAGVARDENRLQNALDAGILAVGIDFPSMSQLQIHQKIDGYLKSNLSEVEYNQIRNIKIVPDVKGRFLTATATAKADTSMMMIAGIKTLDYSAEAQITAASGGAEIAFVLDNTGSMNLEGKLDALKTAATNFTNAIMKKSTGGDVKIGIVPFSNYVNVGLANRGASWLEVEDDYTESYPEQCGTKRDVIAGSCTTETGVNAEGQTYSYLTNCSYGPEYNYCNPAGTRTVKWNGCVGSREYPYNLEDRAYGTRKVPGLMDVWCGAEITPLTNTRSDVINEINAMTGSGNTYIPTGLTWGMRLLSSAAPYSEAASALTAKNKDIKKYLVLMTDGDNTASAQLPGAPTHWGSDVDEANTWTTTVCNNIKAEEITVFTITFGTLLPATKTLIEECASSSAQYFHAATGNELDAAFESIREQISALHLSM